MEKRTYSEKDQSNGNEKDRVDSSQNNRQVKRIRGNNDISQDSCLEETSSIDPSNWAQHTAEGNLSEIISSHVLEKVGMISKEYEQNSKPFRHNVVKDLFVDGFLGKCSWKRNMYAISLAFLHYGVPIIHKKLFLTIVTFEHCPQKKYYMKSSTTSRLNLKRVTCSESIKV